MESVKEAGQTDNRGDTDTHADVTGDLEDQCGSCTKADKTAHIVLAAGANPNDPDDDGKQSQNHQRAAYKTQFFADGGKDKVGMLGEEGAFRLSSVTLEQTLTGHTAAGERTQGKHRVITGADTQSVQLRVEQDLNTKSLVIVQKTPQDGEHGSDAADGRAKPNQIDTAGKGHTHEDKDEDQTNTQVTGQDHVHTGQKTDVEHHCEHTGKQSN